MRQGEGNGHTVELKRDHVLNVTTAIVLLMAGSLLRGWWPFTVRSSIELLQTAGRSTRKGLYMCNDSHTLYMFKWSLYVAND